MKTLYVSDLDGTLLFKELGAKRVVLSREVEIEKVKEISGGNFAVIEWKEKV